MFSSNLCHSQALHTVAKQALLYMKLLSIQAPYHHGPGFSWGYPVVKETKVPAKIEKGVQDLIVKQEAKVDCKVGPWYPSLGFGEKALEKHLRLPYTVPCAEAKMYHFPIVQYIQMYSIIFV